MIPHPAHQPPAPARAFVSGAPGTGALAEHVIATRQGSWWTDRPARPRVVAVTCGGHALLAGDPTALVPADLAPLAGHHVEASARFLPVLAAAFDRLHPWDRMLYVHREPGMPPRLPRGVTVRRLAAGDARALAASAPDLDRVHATWGSPAALAASGHAWAAFHKGRVLAVACARFTGSRYEDVACATAPGERRQHLGLACVEGLTADVAARGHTATWSCSRENRASRLLGWSAGFRLVREYVHHSTGPFTATAVSGTSNLPAAA
ncbi:GNAT family N-acetyltransferase [Streptomyces sp. NPDC094049]|uniref:GNAT family N-acetyltransferase n=1 Tax=Streptomyces sp. NPDC094049 TaxID=3154987 RepID=UPI0033272FD2